MAILEVRDLASGYEGVQILWGVNLALEPGKLTTLVGSNGVGKTTLLKTVMGLMKPLAGTVAFQGRDVSGLSAHNRAKAGMVLVPEGRQLFADMSVWENLVVGGYHNPDREMVIQEMLELFPRLRERSKQLAGTLSGGEQQMLAIARALVARPALLLLDEPSMGLAPLMVQEVFSVIQKLKERGMTIFLVEQNAVSALSIADRAYVMETGEIILEGEASELLHNPEVRRAYLGICYKEIWE